MKIRFIKRAFAETEGRGKGVSYEPGTELDLPETSAQRWLRRGVAVELPLPESPKLKLNRPMMGGAAAVAEPKAEADKPKAEEKAEADKPKRVRGRPKKDAE